MPIDIADLQRKSADLTIKYADDEIAVQYLPHLIDGKVNRMIVEAQQDPELSSLDTALVKILKSWDIEETTSAGKKRPYPLTEPTIKALPILMKLAFANQIVADMLDPNRAASSRAGSPPTETSETAPNGSPS